MGLSVRGRGDLLVLGASAALVVAGLVLLIAGDSDSEGVRPGEAPPIPWTLDAPRRADLAAELLPWDPADDAPARAALVALADRLTAALAGDVDGTLHLRRSAAPERPGASVHAATLSVRARGDGDRRDVVIDADRVGQPPLRYEVTLEDGEIREVRLVDPLGDDDPGLLLPGGFAESPVLALGSLPLLEARALLDLDGLAGVGRSVDPPELVLEIDLAPRLGTVPAGDLAARGQRAWVALDRGSHELRRLHVFDADDRLARTYDALVLGPPDGPAVRVHSAPTASVTELQVLSWTAHPDTR